MTKLSKGCQGSTEICMCSAALFLLISKRIEFLHAPQMLISEGCRPMADYIGSAGSTYIPNNAAALDLHDRALTVTLKMSFHIEHCLVLLFYQRSNRSIG